MIIKEEFFKITDKVYPCLSFYGCILGVGKTCIFNDRIKETHYMNVHGDSLYKISSALEWETKNSILIVKGKLIKPVAINLSLVDIGNDILAKEYLDRLNWGF